MSQYEQFLQKQNLQKLLSLYHPHKDKLFSEYTLAQEAASQIEILEIALDCINEDKSFDIIISRTAGRGTALLAASAAARARQSRG